MNQQIKELHEYLGHHGEQWKVVNAKQNETYEYCEHCDLILFNNEKVDYLPHLWWFGEAVEVTEPVKKIVQYSHGIGGLYACGLNKIDNLIGEEKPVIAEFVRCFSDMIRFNRPLPETKLPQWLFTQLMEIDEMWMAMEWRAAGRFEGLDPIAEDEDSARPV